MARRAVDGADSIEVTGVVSSDPSSLRLHEQLAALLSLLKEKSDNE